MKTNPIIPWMGGKRRLASRLIPKFPNHSCYVELFCGGAALFFLRPEPAKVEVINDLDGELINLYRVVQNHLEEFIKQFKWSLTSRTMFNWIKEAYCPGLTDIQRAARFYYLQQHAFGAKRHGQNFGTATTGRPINLCRIEENLSEAHIRLAGTYIEHLSWIECFKRYDRPHTFFYADPPYWQLTGYNIDFGLDQYESLAECMKLSQGKIMVSLNDHVDMRKVFKDFRIESLDIKYSLSCDQKSKSKTSNEIMITNF
ncbi:DNA adenine methylase [Acinetobacter ursingii]|uniref:DNA adenine methylase n=1 Tax=Acinetobacter ursingii TaxID=108980 RepID=UPI0024467ED2|nr:DNA adenine methylase [Acinetobacter ursingii]MDG9992340.1 DNA adenine methylase [Acinetobacter ursingii]MDH0204331.1 DNA adenine methylase [Acinetobacter ursingii]